MTNYYNYFTEIEEHFQRRRGTLLLLSTLDWALIDVWREAEIPIEAVRRGIDAAFDKREARKHRGRLRPVNSLAYCAQAVIEAAEAMQDAAVGAKVAATADDHGFGIAAIAEHLQRCAHRYHSQAQSPAIAATAPMLATLLAATAGRLEAIAQEISGGKCTVEDLERNLATLEEKVGAALLATASEEKLVALRDESARELAPYRRKMQTAQLQQVERQFLTKRLFEAAHLPRLSLFYMEHK